MKTALAIILLAACCCAAGRAEEKTVRLGVSFSKLDPFRSTIAEAAVARAEELPGVELTLVEAGNDAARQLEQIDQLLENGVDALIVCIVEAASGPAVIEAAKTARVPLVFVNFNPFYQKVIPAGCYVVSSNSFMEGVRGMDYVGKRLEGRGNIVILRGTPDHESTIGRSDGIWMIVRDRYPNMTVLAEEDADYDREEGRAAMERLILAHGNRIDAVVSHNDEMAIGAVQALKAHGMKDWVIVVGVDGTAEGLASIASGGMDATAYQDQVAQGAGSVNLALKVLAGEKVEVHTRLPVPFVTRDNVEKFLKQ